MKRVLVAYASLAGSTAEVAQAIGEELRKAGLEVDVQPISGIKSIEGYDGAVLGGPMIMGWHRAALGFLRRHRKSLRQVPLAIFVLAMKLTDTGESSVGGVHICVDEALPEAPQDVERLTFRERYATLTNYARPILRALRPAAPISLGFFGGRLEYGRLPWWAVLFAMLVVQARAGDRRNWQAIRAWANSLGGAFQPAAGA